MRRDKEKKVSSELTCEILQVQRGDAHTKPCIHACFWHCLSLLAMSACCPPDGSKVQKDLVGKEDGTDLFWKWASPL